MSGFKMYSLQFLFAEKTTNKRKNVNGQWYTEGLKVKYVHKQLPNPYVAIEKHDRI